MTIVPTSVEPSLNLISPPSAFKIISPPTSKSKSPASEIVEPLIVISSTVKLSAVIEPVTSNPLEFNAILLAAAALNVNVSFEFV